MMLTIVVPHHTLMMPMLPIEEDHQHTMIADCHHQEEEHVDQMIDHHMMIIIITTEMRVEKMSETIEKVTEEQTIEAQEAQIASHQ
ncbi:hypothetical protein TRFO_21341 [Tritrichomonas foetus]|uniref:Uncharacterized protein n=1 Tax=Tritrichomonas foetus TaxID=1144522 RepID=A0A1J4KFK0_9EUKA|nr:hypothetical protein TRFO_21341 [Tritrichomonas foetus]|eukprot:OHT09712.1 hypothetical protein TRFO_21341 [Tritrichomonas foetus]